MADHLPRNIRDTLERLKKDAPNDRYRDMLNLLDASLGSMVPVNEDEGSAIIHVESMVSSRTQKPFVTVQWGNNKAQFTPDEARAHALSILGAAESSVQDAAIHSFMTRSGGKVEDGFRMITAIREHRKQFESQEGSET